MTDIPEAGHKAVKSASKKNTGIALGVIFAILLVVIFVVVFYKPSRRLVNANFDTFCLQMFVFFSCCEGSLNECFMLKSSSFDFDYMGL